MIENVHTPDSEPEPIIPDTLGDRYERVMCKLAPQIAAEQARGRRLDGGAAH